MIDIIVFSLLGLGLLFTLLRFVIGPSLSDKVVSLDTFNMIIIGVIAMLALIFNNELYLDIVIIFAILSFLETIVFARYLEAKKDGNS
ncbi:MAG: hypothetical protein JXC31_03890 [Acholeplasmataceae bacterium]|nr:hypothetical protein [Acholeplasmataceae bacterium]